MFSSDQIFQIVSDSIYKQMKCDYEQIILLYDLDSPLAKILSEQYLRALPSHAQSFLYQESQKQQIIELLRNLPSGSNVFLVQSTNFRLDDFRIRLQLFNNGVGCLEHSMLYTVPDDKIQTYLDAFAWRGDDYARLASEMAKLINNASEMKIYSGEKSVLTFGQMEASRINDSRFYSQKNRGGGAICGELFSEVKDFSQLNGELTIDAYPDETFSMVWCEPFTLTIKESFIVGYSQNTPQAFLENVFFRVQEGEGDGKVMIREAGFGLNPALSKQTPLPYVNMCERMIGFHVSVGKKHNIYRNKFSKDVMQRYHIDIFSDLKKIECDGVVLFENGNYTV